MSKFKRIATSVVASGAVLALEAHAAVPAEAQKALEDAKDDGTMIGGIVLGVIIAIVAFKYVRKAL